MTDEHYHLEYHRAMAEAYGKQQKQDCYKNSICLAIDREDYLEFIAFKNKNSFTTAEAFHQLVTHHHV